MNAALLPLFMVVPLMAAAVLTLVRHPVASRALTVGLPLLSTVGGIALLVAHLTRPVLTTHIGGFSVGVAITFASDTLSALLIVVMGLVTAVSTVFLALTRDDRLRFVPALVMMLLGGVNGALLTADLFNLFVCIEVMLLPSYALIAVTGTWRRLAIGRLFTVVNIVTSTLLLLGVGLVYGAAGTVNLAQLSGLARNDDQVNMAMTVVLLALCVKAGVAPVHTWLPRTYPVTSAGMMTLFSGVHTKVAVYALFRVYATAYGGYTAWMPVFLAVLVATMLIGAFSTAADRRYRGAFGYQMVAGVGHILLALVIYTPAALAAGLFYMVHHIVTMGALLLAAGAVEHTYGMGRIERLGGLARREPWIAGITAVGLFSLIGLPPTSGLWGKVGLVQAALSGGGSWQPSVIITAIAVTSLVTVLSLQYVWAKVFWGSPMTQYRPEGPNQDRSRLIPLPDDVRAPRSLLVPAAVLAGVSVALFALAGALMPTIQRAADGLIDTSAYVTEVLR